MIWISISSPMRIDSPARRRITSMRPRAAAIPPDGSRGNPFGSPDTRAACSDSPRWAPADRSEEHTSELQSLRHLVCRLLLEKTKDHDSLFSRDTAYSPPTGVYANESLT